ncbi:MAG: hypothetical protein K2X90_03870 [Candidatus Babeliaceae bacterium]|nr:hypothetical protein [Candidatus Babeliaceae bacterium]
MKSKFTIPDILLFLLIMIESLKATTIFAPTIISCKKNKHATCVTFTADDRIRSWELVRFPTQPNILAFQGRDTQEVIVAAFKIYGHCSGNNQIKFFAPKPGVQISEPHATLQDAGNNILLTHHGTVDLSGFEDFSQPESAYKFSTYCDQKFADMRVVTLIIPYKMNGR